MADIYIYMYNVIYHDISVVNGLFDQLISEGSPPCILEDWNDLEPGRRLQEAHHFQLHA